MWQCHTAPNTQTRPRALACASVPARANSTRFGVCDCAPRRHTDTEPPGSTDCIHHKQIAYVQCKYTEIYIAHITWVIVCERVRSDDVYVIAESTINTSSSCMFTEQSLRIPVPTHKHTNTPHETQLCVCGFSGKENLIK